MNFIPYVKVFVHSMVNPQYALVDGKNMIESKTGVLGTKSAKLDKTKTDSCWYGIGSKAIWVKFDLHKGYDLDEIKIWNHRQEG